MTAEAGGHEVILEHTKRCRCIDANHVIAWTNWKLVQAETALAAQDHGYQLLEEERQRLHDALAASQAEQAEADEMHQEVLRDNSEEYADFAKALGLPEYVSENELQGYPHILARIKELVGTKETPHAQ